MPNNIPLFPAQASTMATRVDALMFFLLAVCLFFIVVIFVALVIFSIRYRRRPGDSAPKPIKGSFWLLETVWIGVPFVIAVAIFLWGAAIFYFQANPPANAMEIHVIGRQWMWKFQHMNGRREINELHIPIGEPVKLIMGSEDVIHDLYVPAFRVKQDVIPGRLTTLWFQATKTGTYHLFCAEYCGTQHSRMKGWVHVMEPRDFEKWVSGDTGATPAQAGEQLFTRYACNTCHSQASGARGPNLEGIFGRAVRLNTGRSVLADESYLRESIMNPSARIVEGYQPIMPTFQGQVTEEQTLQLIAYIKSLGTAAGDAQTTGTEAAAPAAGTQMTTAAKEAK